MPTELGERHPLSERFHQLLREVGELHDRKQQDYGSDQDPFANINQAKEWGIEPWVAALLRAGEKLQRLKAFVRKGNLANETVVDSLKDLPVYGLIALVLYENRTEIEHHGSHVIHYRRRKHVRGHRRATKTRRTRRKHR